MDWIEQYRKIDGRTKEWAEIEKVKVIRQALAGDMSKTEIAKLLGTNRKAIYRLLKKYQHAELEEINAIT